MSSDEGCNSYISQMQHDIGAGMAMAISNWGTDWNTMKWLDSDTGCQGDCQGSPVLSITNIQYTTGSTPPPPPAGQYDYGNPCKTSHDDDCAKVSGCTQDRCRWSWPHNDPAKWASKDAKCRCKPADAIEEEAVEIIQ